MMENELEKMPEFIDIANAILDNRSTEGRFNFGLYEGIIYHNGEKVEIKCFEPGFSYRIKIEREVDQIG